jgi:sensor histidine kinase YesM
MEKRFITVQREFASLKEYAYIFCHIYGSLLQTPFECAPEAEQAMIPTMILQPVLENALVHGVRREEAVVSITASCPEEGRLSVRVQDNGVGMSQELIDRILTSDEALPEHDGKKSAGIGLRNVRDRLQLIYSDRASLSIESGSQCGTAVTISLPLSYQEERFTEPD